MAQFLSTIDPLLPLLEKRPVGVFSDIDGTLAPIVSRPEDARVSDACRRSLQALIEHDVRVVLVTGRTLDMARQMVGMEGVAYGASHGLEVSVDGSAEAASESAPYVERMHKVRAELADLRVDGLTVEEKGPILAFHYRNSLNEWAARGTILDAIGRSTAAEGLKVQEGRKVIELCPPLDINKGTALEGLAKRLGVSSLLCLGDDRTDIDMFRTVSRLRDGGTPGATVAVSSDEIPSELVEVADYRVNGVPSVEKLLGELVTALR
jgi:trehalose 6-phosphate phosphatase